MDNYLSITNPLPENVNLFNYSLPLIGYVSRTNTPGPEFDMVKQYVLYLINKYKKLKKKSIAVFIEPQIDTGYPDIVIVEYFSLPNLQWEKARNKLTISDLKILYYIQSIGNISIEQISSTLGYSSDAVTKSVKRLSESRLVYYSSKNSTINKVKLSSYCRIKSIIAVEAKVDKWKDALRQASNNTWFSTESFILMKRDTYSRDIIESCKEKGIGVIIINGKIKTKLSSAKRGFPVSYASLQFNEWLLRRINNMGDQL